MSGWVTELHPEVVAMLEEQRRGGAKPRSQMTVEETRVAMTAGRKWQLAPPANVPVRDAVANGVPVRLYGDEHARTLLYLHGGRFFSGNLDSHDWPLRLLADVSKVRICAVNYRLAPEHRHPAAVEDTIAAGRWLRGQTDEMIVGGDSAGGYLAALGALALHPVLQVLIYPMLDPATDTASYREYWQGPWPSGEDMARGWELYGGEAVNAGSGAFPSTLLVTAGVDALRDEAMAFGASLRACGVAVEEVHYPDMHHGFFTQTRLARSRELIQWLAAALRRHLPLSSGRK
ncbi:MAG: alpha/beta hydrolase [Bryobacterales bacterium]|nr:alpha/beta hydrolase [Bryobacterales bacterium]